MLSPLFLEASDDTPHVHFNKDEGIFEISGRSLPEDVVKFYTPIIEWINKYAQQPNDKTIIKLKLDYFNSASQRYIVEVLSAFEPILKSGKEVIIEWHYKDGDDEMKETGEEYTEFVDIPVKLVPYNK